MKVTKEMGIAEILERHPFLAEVFFEMGIGCVGCAAARFETIEEGLKAHGLSDEKIKETIDKMNKLVEEKKESS